METSSTKSCEIGGSTSTNGTTSKVRKQEIDWGKYGLAEKSSYEPRKASNLSEIPRNGTSSEVRELFDEEGELHQANEPWWKTSFFITKTLLFGTWDGVFTTCLMNIVGVVIFLRTGWMVGYAGIGLSLLIVVISLCIALATVMSAVGVCDRCHVRHGGVYFIVSHVLGGKIGGSVGLLYCLGHAVATSMYCIGFAESFASLVGWDNTWAIRGIGLTVLVVLLTIALSGVKWVIRFQLILVLILAVAVLDFIIGTLVHDDPVYGFTGFSNENFKQNAKPMFTEKVHFFTVLGVFFPAACGVMSGVNMSGDLKDPAKSIPIGSTAALAVTGGFYVVFIFLLGSTCTRDALKSDSMIMQKVSVIGFLFLLGLFVSSLSSILGGVVGPPRVLQTIAEDNILPVMKPFAKKRGSSNEPQNATIMISIIVTLFILIGKLNTLATIATMPFLLTYIAINYSYFALAMSYDIKQKQKEEASEREKNGAEYQRLTPNGKDCSSEMTENEEKGTERIPLIEQRQLYGSQATEKSGSPDTTSEITPGYEDESTEEEVMEVGKPMNEKKSAIFHVTDREEPTLEFITDKEPNELYSKLCNRWVSLITSGLCLILMFCISWTYSLASISIILLLYIFISQSNPGLSHGVAHDFSFSTWIKSMGRQKSQSPNQRQIVVQRNFVPYGISMYQMTQENTDYALRDRKHHSSVLTSSVPYD